ncbi:PAS domain S-box protein [Hymenobacter artigasi]|uniref:histidine kinase n=1 Tax=Hymenobacter artigasi TaxID=2719616 RepID=A0ABX1HI46_9BACT|nr:PAS domain-containing sensor histidine kinase [Hymenobacter artigasi]NKI89928.1 PAS domain S-box-containing protein [Hymenobacter artigasi]
MYNPADTSGNFVAANKALAKREHQLSVLFDTIADVTFVLNVEGEGRYRFVFANKAFEKTTGLPVEQVVGRYVEDIIPEPSLSLVLTKYREAISSMERVIWQETTDYPTGQVTGEVSVTPVPDEHGRCCQLVGVVHDLTKEKQVEKALRISNERLAYALKATTDAIYDWTISDDSLYWGEGFEDLFGYQLAQNPTPFSEWADYVHPDDSPRVVAGLRHAAFETTNLFWQEEYRFRRANGTWAEVFDRGYLLRDAVGRAVRMMGAMQDITSRKQAERQRQQLTEKLISQNADLYQFAYIVSHNLRAPLANALGFSDLLTRVDKESVVFGASLQKLQTSLRLFDEVLTDVNEILLVRDEQAGYRPEPVPLAAVCQQALQGLHEALQAAGGQLHIMIPADLRVAGSRAYFHSIFHNLISNAIKYRAESRPLRINIVSTTAAAQGLAITVRDNGSGFDRERAGDNVFQLYRRFHVGQSGRGIGLYLVRAHVEAMGGQVTVASRPNEGTEFTLYFRPYADENLPH